MEVKNGLTWLSFSDATALFMFRKIPGLTITTSHVIFCKEGRYNIISLENVKGKGMYIEVLVKIDNLLR